MSNPAPFLLLLAALPLCSAQTHGLSYQQPEQIMEQGANIGAAEAHSLEAQLEKSPHDLIARTKLLGYYYYAWMQPGEEAARAARRKHILWLIENHPESPILALAEVTIEDRGNSLADPDGYHQARQLWLSQMESKKDNVQVLGNAARFFQMTDKNLAESILLRAQALQPYNKEWDWRLGYLYGMGILGVDALGLNGQPTSVDPILAAGPFAAKSRQALAATKSGTMLAMAAQILWRYGTMLSTSGEGKLTWLDQAIQLIEQARAAEPSNPSWPQYLRQLQASQQEAATPAPKLSK
jgi:hypothetical protein